MLFPIIAWIASVFTFIYCMILCFKTFTGKLRPEKLDKNVHEAPIGMLVSPHHFSCNCYSHFLFPKCY